MKETMNTPFDLRLLSPAQNLQFESLLQSGVEVDDDKIEELRNQASGRNLGPIAAPSAVISKLELAQKLSLQLDDLFSRNPKLSEDPLMWNALTLHWIPYIWANGAKQRSEYFIFRSFGRDRYRHRLAGPYFLFKRFKSSNSVASLLGALEPNVHGELLEQLLSRQYVFFSDAAWSTAARIYLNEKGSIIRGALGKGPGSTRRFGIVMQQLAVTYDTSLLDEETLMRLLPAEFAKFANH